MSDVEEFGKSVARILDWERLKVECANVGYEVASISADDVLIIQTFMESAFLLIDAEYDYGSAGGPKAPKELENELYDKRTCARRRFVDGVKMLIVRARQAGVADEILVPFSVAQSRMDRTSIEAALDNLRWVAGKFQRSATVDVNSDWISHSGFSAMLGLGATDLTAKEQSKLMERVRKKGTDGVHFVKRGNEYFYQPKFCITLHKLLTKRKGADRADDLRELLNDPTPNEIAAFTAAIRKEKGIQD